jgi:type I restriction enzyme, S subunit
VIISTVRTYLRAIAKIKNPEENLIVSTGFIVIRPQGVLFPDFLGYMAFSEYLIQQVISRSYGVSYPAINAIDLVAIPVTIPTFPEQTQIAAFLDRETAKIDALVAEQQKLIELLKEKIVSMALISFSKGESRMMRLINAASVVSRPVYQEEGTEYKPLGLFNRGRGIFHKEPRDIHGMGDSDFFWVKENDLILSGQFAWEGAIALASGEEEGCIVSHRYHVLQGKQGITTTEYLLALFSSEFGDFLLNENSRGAAGRNRPLNINTLLKEKIPIPNMDIQIKIAEVIHLKNRLLKEMSRQTGFLQERRTALISAAVTGQIDVRSIVPLSPEKT